MFSGHLAGIKVPPQPFPVSDLLTWAETQGRRPPWRDYPEAFGLALAEVLLQKTKADAVVEPWRECVRLFPTPESLSDAPDWQVHQVVKRLGLGLQRTSRLKAMAKNWETLWNSKSSLPGLGPYGSSIVRLASGLQDAAAPIDGNIARIICRYYGLQFQRGEARKKPEVGNAVRGALEGAGEPRNRLMLLYGLVDLGAIVCKPSKPSCEQCPLRLGCVSCVSPGASAIKNSFTAFPRDRARGGGTASDTS